MSIYIKPENRGKFTEYAKQHGKSVQQMAADVLSNKEDYSASTVKRGNFARNAAGWQKAAYGMNVQEPPPTPLSFNLGKVQSMMPSGFFGHGLGGRNLTPAEEYELGMQPKPYEQRYAFEMPEIANRPYSLSTGIPNMSAQNNGYAGIPQVNPMVINTPNGQPSPYPLDYPSRSVERDRTLELIGRPPKEVEMPDLPLREYNDSIGPYQNRMNPEQPVEQQQQFEMPLWSTSNQADQNTDYISGMPGFEFMRQNKPLVLPTITPGQIQQPNTQQTAPSNTPSMQFPVQTITPGQIPNETPLPSSLMNVPPIQNSPSVNQTPSDTPTTPDSTRYNPQKYFDLIKTIDLTALARNMAQGPPPNIITPRTHLPRVYYDRGMFDSAKQQAAESNLRGMYEARQQLGQAGDFQQLATSYNAQNMQQQQAIGQQQRELNQHELLQNAQIAGQEQQMQDQQNLQEAQANYQIQMAGKAAKDAAIQHQLGAIKHDVQLETQYNVQRDVADRQEALDLEYKKAQEDLGLTGMEMQWESMYQNNPQYEEGRLSAINKHRQEVDAQVLQEMQNDPALKSLIEETGYQGYNLLDYADLGKKMQYAQTRAGELERSYQLEQQKYQDFQSELQQLESNPPPANATESEIDQYNNQLEGLRRSVQTYGETVKGLEGEYKNVESEFGKMKKLEGLYKESDKRFSGRYDTEKISSDYDETYREADRMFNYLKEMRKKRGQ